MVSVQRPEPKRSRPHDRSRCTWHASYSLLSLSRLETLLADVTTLPLFTASKKSTRPLHTIRILGRVSIVLEITSKLSTLARANVWKPPDFPETHVDITWFLFFPTSDYTSPGIAESLLLS